VKRILSVVIAIIAILALTVPAMAFSPTQTQDVNTNVTVDPTTVGNAPIIKAKWETKTDDIACPLDDDPPCSGMQLDPPLSYLGTVPIFFWAIVTDPDGLINVQHVYVDVNHPAGYPEQGSFKFQVELFPLNSALDDGVISKAEADAALAWLEAADKAMLVTYAGSHPYDDCWDELDQGEAYIWVGEYYMDYHQPCGDYTVKAYGFDVQTNQSAILQNTFEYVCYTAAEIDFTSVDYGTVTVSSEKPVSGDTHFYVGDGKPTIRNIGNTWFHIEIRQDDMGFGYTSSPAGWNVAYDVRLGAATEGNDKLVFDPSDYKGALGTGDKWYVVPGIINLCNTWKVDFSIHVKKAVITEPGDAVYSGKMQLKICCEPFTGPNLSHPGTSD
jgi:hypothetical protein